MIGLMIIFGLLVFEIILFFKLNQLKEFEFKLIRNVRVLMFVLMFFLIVFGVITWSFRYYGLSIVLVSMGVLNHIKSLKEISKQKPYTNQSNIKKTILTILLFVLIMLPSLIFPEYEPLETTGIYKVSQSVFIIEDENRIETFSNQNEHRQVSIRVWYPDQEGDIFPLVLYSHGGISLDSSNESLFLELASHGYVVFSIGHPYHSIVTKDNKGRNVWINGQYMNELNSENARVNPEESFRLYQKWMQLRTDDLNFVIDYTKLEIINNETNDVFNQIDIENIGVIGHSLGGSAALCLGRTRTDVKAVIALESPYMCDILGVNNETFIIDDAIYLVPVLNVYSDSTWDYLAIYPQYEQNYRMLDNDTAVVRNVHIDGTGHFSLTDLSLTSPFMTRFLNGFKSTRGSKEVLQRINEVSLNFLDEYLKD